MKLNAHDSQLVRIIKEERWEKYKIDIHMDLGFFGIKISVMCAYSNCPVGFKKKKEFFREKDP